ncbi:MAG TPA: aldolase/citrate lyase family protein [Longimicrobiales bacterium]|nr:aldolase/citrate lyase family protein [Longimicrobiales bacterium]
MSASFPRLLRSAAPPTLAPLAGLALSLVFAAAAGAQEMRLNRTIETLEAGAPTLGLATGNFSLVNARSLAVSELDFIIIDMEHSPYDVETLQEFILGMVDVGRAVEKGSTQMDVTPIVRIPMNGRENLQFLVKQVLDVGAYGVMFPFVNTRDEAMNAVAAMRYPQPRGDAQPEPRGLRGSSPGNARWIWGARDYGSLADVWPLDPGGELLAVIQIETPEGVSNIDAIATVPGVGAIFIGPADLGLNLGVPGNHPDLEAAIQTVLESCKRHGVPCGITTGSGSVEERLAQGFRFVTVSWGGDAGISPSASEALTIGRRAAGRSPGN